MPSVSAFGKMPEDALTDLKSDWEVVKGSYDSRGVAVPVVPDRMKYDSHLNVYINRTVHRALAMEAAQAGTSLDALVVGRLAKSVGI